MASKISVLKSQLEEQKARLIRDLEAARETAASSVTPADESRYSNHQADEATTTYQQEANLAVEQHLKRELQSVEAALHRIEEGTYGVCESCGKPIAADRLEALPTATLCITCKTRQSTRR